MGLNGAFTALLLLINGVSAVIVLPPTNVTVSCQNLKVTVSWEYSEQQPGTSFLVTPKGTPGCPNDKPWTTTDHQYDMTSFIWQSEECYMALHYVSVTAVHGDNKCKLGASKSFSFNELKTVDSNCQLDFPPVRLDLTDSGAKVSFENPFHFYGELKQADKPDNALFLVHVTSDDGNEKIDDRFECTAMEETCKHDIVFPDGVEKCVTLNGLLFDADRSGKVQVVNGKPICASEPPEVHVMVLLIILSVAVVIISLLILVICKVKAWTMKTPPLPNPLRLSDEERQDLRYDPVPAPYISRIGLGETCKNPSISSEEEDDPTEPLQNRGASCDVHPPSAASYTTGNLLENSCQAPPEEHRKDDDDSADGSVKTECTTIDSEEEAAAGVERSPYDCPHVMQVDIDDGEMADAYTER